MTTRSLIFVNASMFSFAFVGLVSSMSTSSLTFASADLVFSLFASLVPSLSTSLLMIVVQDVTKPFYLGKPVKNAKNTIVLI